MFAVSQQIRMFLSMALAGVILAATFDWHRAWRAVLRPRGWRSHVLDLAFVPVGASIVAGGLLAANWGDLRAYAFGGLVLGAWVYARLGSPVLLPAEQAVAGWTLAAGRAGVRLALWPYRLGRTAAAGAMRLGEGAGDAAGRAAHWAGTRAPGWLERLRAHRHPPSGPRGPRLPRRPRPPRRPRGGPRGPRPTPPPPAPRR